MGRSRDGEELRKSSHKAPERLRVVYVRQGTGCLRPVWWLFLTVKMESGGHPGVLSEACLAGHVCVYWFAALGGRRKPT